MLFFPLIEAVFIGQLINGMTPEVGLLTVRKGNDFLTSQVLVLYSKCSASKSCDEPNSDCMNQLEKLNRQLENVLYRLQTIESVLPSYNEAGWKIDKLDERLRLLLQALSFHNVSTKGTILLLFFSIILHTI